MLLRMYTRWAEQHAYKIDHLAETQGEEAGIRSATVKDLGTGAQTSGLSHVRLALPGGAV
jgi:peptide chain release factor 2